MLEIEIDGKKVAMPTGGTIMDAAALAGIYIPHFCYHKKLSIAANCRMCLVQVEKANKPLPACATPVTDGMKVSTRSEVAVRAQKGVMEFLLINHPLDCPICDQGGECALQDLAVGYGGVGSRYQEAKRVVTEKDLGPLVATDMTRCIHCTRCVRFGQEIAGIMEMGQTGRGEHSEIMPFINQTIDSELSGNIIDLCPVGALTSKPFRYSARTWELSRRRSVAPHDSLGSNLAIHVKDQRVMRVLPLENEAINECWISDRDRFSYEGLNSPDRLTRPMLKRDGQWGEVDWQVALEHVASSLQDIRTRFGTDSIGALASPTQTLEELYLLQKLVRGLDSGYVDARPRQADFGADAHLGGAPWLGMPVQDINQLDRVLLVGGRLRRDHPLIAHRLRVAVRHGAHFSLINPVDDDLLMAVSHKSIVAPQAMEQQLVQLAAALQRKTGRNVSDAVVARLAGVVPDAAAQAMADDLLGGERRAILLGNLAQQHPGYAGLHGWAQQVADLCGATLGVLGEAANSTGARVAGAWPAVGKDARAMIEVPRKAYVLLGLEPEFDCHDPVRTAAALRSAGLVVGLSAFRPTDMSVFDVLLPVAPFTETAGTFVNAEGRVQTFKGAAQPLGESRPAWKVLRVLATMLGMEDCAYDSVEAVRAALLPTGQLPTAALNNRLEGWQPQSHGEMAETVWRLGDVPAYRCDALVRRAPSLQRVRDTEADAASAHPQWMARAGWVSGQRVRLRQGDATTETVLLADERVAPGCVRLAAAQPLAVALGAMMGEISVERA